MTRDYHRVGHRPRVACSPDRLATTRVSKTSDCDTEDAAGSLSRRRSEPSKNRAEVGNFSRLKRAIQVNTASIRRFNGLTILDGTAEKGVNPSYSHSTILKMEKCDGDVDDATVSFAWH